MWSGTPAIIAESAMVQQNKCFGYPLLCADSGVCWIEENFAFILLRFHNSCQESSKRQTNKTTFGTCTHAIHVKKQIECSICSSSCLFIMLCQQYQHSKRSCWAHWRILLLLLQWNYWYSLMMKNDGMNLMLQSWHYRPPMSWNQTRIAIF